jgi:uncharacterized membrane protein
MTKIIVILLIGLIFEATGVVFLSGGLKQIGEIEKVSVSEIVRVVKKGATNHRILIGIALEAIFFGCLCYLLSRQDVSLIWPLTALGFVITAISAKIFLNEQISWVRWLGISLIVIGAGVTTYSEKLKEKKDPVLPVEAPQQN